MTPFILSGVGDSLSPHFSGPVSEAKARKLLPFRIYAAPKSVSMRQLAWSRCAAVWVSAGARRPPPAQKKRRLALRPGGVDRARERGGYFLMRKRVTWPRRWVASSASCSLDEAVWLAAWAVSWEISLMLTTLRLISSAVMLCSSAPWRSACSCP